MSGPRKQLVGRRVRLIRCSDRFTRIEPGEEGTIVNVDDIGTTHVTWDNGVRLGLVPDQDEWEVLP
jgi:hypothetical protein